MTPTAQNRRRTPRRKSGAYPRTALKTVKDDLAACIDRVADLERTLKDLRAEVDHLREKIRI